MRLPPLVSFVAPSGTGKTTYLERLLPALRSRGLRVAALKHDAHRFEVDREGKDTYRLRRAGADPVVITSRSAWAALGALDGELPLLASVERFAPRADLVVTEGYRRSGIPKVRVHRAARGEDAGWEPGDGVIARVSDAPPQEGVPTFPLDDPEPLAAFLTERFDLGVPERPRRLRGVVLAGGRSTRMGADKAWMEAGGIRLLPRLTRLLEATTGAAPWVVARPDQPLPDTGARVLTDLFPDRGPLGGLLTALGALDLDAALVLACDMPWVEPALAAGLGRWGDPRADAWVPVADGRPQPLFAAYGPGCLPAVYLALRAGEHRMDGFWGAVDVSFIPQSTWRSTDPEGRSFVNWNRPEDLPPAGPPAT